MIARMTKDGVITIEPQNGAEVVALKHWEQENRIDGPGNDSVIRGAAVEIIEPKA